MEFAAYLSLMRRKGVTPLVIVGLIARLPHAAIGIVMTLHIVGQAARGDLGRSYLEAGLVTAALTIGQFFGAPWRGRVVDRKGLRRALLPSVTVDAAIWCAAPFLPYYGLLIAAFVAGVFMVPAFSVIRQSMAVIAPKEEQQTAFALDAVVAEIAFVFAPVLGVWLCTTYSGVAGLITIGVLTFVTGGVLMWFNPPTRSTQIEGRGELAGQDDAELARHGDAPGAGTPAGGDGGQAGGRGRLRGRPGTGPASIMSGPLIAVLGATMAIAFTFGGADLSIVALLKHWDLSGSTGGVLAVWSGFSAIGGLVYGAMKRSFHPLLMVFVLSAATVPLGLAPSVLVLCAGFVVVGLLTAPALTSINSAVVQLVPEARRGEALGWNGSAMTVGSTISAPICGALIDTLGPGWGFFSGGGIGAVLALAGLAVYRRRRA